MKISDINPYIRYAEILMFSRQISNYRAYDNHIYYIKDGRGTVTSGENKYNFSSGSIVFVPAGKDYLFDTDNQISVYSINFDFTQARSDMSSPIFPALSESFDFSKITEKAEFDDYPLLSTCIVINYLTDAKESFDKIADEFALKEHFYKETSSAELKSLITRILRYLSDGIKTNRKVVKIQRYIKEHYKEDISNSSIAYEFGYHPYHLNRLFKATTGSTVHQYMSAYRIEMAKNYLSKTDVPINQICFLCGFNDFSNFSREFKKACKITPREYRKNAKSLM